MVKIERSFPAPASLAEEAKKKNGSYSKSDVIERLRQDFHNKCYICEMKELQDPQVEHRLPHKNGKYPQRKFDWENLFWVCGHCNQVKNQSVYDDGILDCCKRDPERYISFRCNQEDVQLNRKTAAAGGQEEDAEIDRTMALVRDVFNLRNTGMRTYTSDIRFKKLQKEMNILFDNLEKIKQHPNSKVTAMKLKALLSRESAFAAFKRCYVREHLSEYPALQAYISF